MAHVDKLSPLGQWVYRTAVTLGLDKVPADVHPEPEPTWILGHRYYDLAISLVFALLLPIFRRLMTYCVYEPFAMRILYSHQKKDDDFKANPEQMRKWNESCWKATMFTIMPTIAFLVSYQERWFLDSRYWWLGCSHFPPCNLPVSRGVLLYYCVATGFYLQSIHFLAFHEVRRKDWIESMAHHVVTAGLLVYSYYVNFTRVGVMVMLIHDVSDIFLEVAKLGRYAKNQAVANGFFVVFFLSWLLFRCIVFPFYIIRSTLFEPVALVAAQYGIEPSPHYEIFNAALLVLLVLHIYWTWLIFKVLLRQLRSGAAADVREDDEDSD